MTSKYTSDLHMVSLEIQLPSVPAQNDGLDSSKYAWNMHGIVVSNWVGGFYDPKIHKKSFTNHNPSLIRAHELSGVGFWLCRGCGESLTSIFKSKITVFRSMEIFAI